VQVKKLTPLQITTIRSQRTRRSKTTNVGGAAKKECHMPRPVTKVRLKCLEEIPDDKIIPPAAFAPVNFRCNKCHRPMLGSTSLDGACECGGLIEAAP
jgi:hypothetical protein